MVTPANDTVVAIRREVRHLTNSPSENMLTTTYIDETLNDIYNSDFAYGIKLDQMRSVYEIYTQPNIDRYPLDVNFNQSVRGPAYFDGVQGGLYKDRLTFYNLWPKLTSEFQQGSTTLTGTITGIAQPTNPTEITSVAHGLTDGAVVLIEDVGGMTQLNDNFYTITVIDDNTFSIPVDNTAFGAYTSGGTWTAISQSFSFTLSAPFLSQEVQIGGVDVFGNPITIKDDGDGNLLMITPNPRVTVPTQLQSPKAPIPGMLNQNTGNPGLYSPLTIGSVDYVSGVFDFTLPNGISLGSGQVFTIRVALYTTSKPYSILFWNNEFTIRPVPDKIHKITVETYFTPVQFLQTTDVPILNQWWKYLAYLVSAEIQRRRGDFDSVKMLQEGLQRQEALVLERQACEEIGTPTPTMFNTPYPVTYLQNFWGTGQY